MRKSLLPFCIGLISGIILTLAFEPLYGFFLMRRNETVSDELFEGYQIEILQKTKYQDKSYDLALRTSGLQDKVYFLEIYNINLSDYINSNRKYVYPIFSEAIDEKWDELGHPTRSFEEADVDFENKKVTIFFTNNEREYYEYNFE